MPAAAPWPPANDPQTSRPAPPSTSVLAAPAAGDGEGEGRAGEAGEEGEGPAAAAAAAAAADLPGGDPEFPVLVNAGDMLSRWSNGSFKSVLHRVALSEAGRDRYSAAFFLDPPWACRVEPAVAAAASSPGPPGGARGPRPPFPATTYGEYLVAKFEKTHLSYGAAAGAEVERRRKGAGRGGRGGGHAGEASGGVAEQESGREGDAGERREFVVIVSTR